MESNPRRFFSSPLCFWARSADRRDAEWRGADDGSLHPEEMVRLSSPFYFPPSVFFIRWCFYFRRCFGCSSATNMLITAKDHASVQINIGHLDENGLYTGQFSTFALCGFIRAQVRLPFFLFFDYSPLILSNNFSTARFLLFFFPWFHLLFWYQLVKP